MAALDKPTPDPMLPCPWCGSDDIKTFRCRTERGTVDYVQCMNCTSCGPDHIDGRHWNERNFRPQMAKWLRERAEKQDQINAECPTHAAAYESWRRMPAQLRMYAAEVESGK